MRRPRATSESESSPARLACVLICAAVLIVGDGSVEAAGTDQVAVDRTLARPTGPRSRSSPR